MVVAMLVVVVVWFFFLAVGYGCHMEVVAGGVVVEVDVASWKVFVVDFFFLISSLYYFNQIAKNIDPLMLGVL